MEYFNFEDASRNKQQYNFEDDFTSLDTQYNEQADDDFDAYLFNQSQNVPQEPVAAPSTLKLKLINDVEIEAIPQPGDLNQDYPMFRAKEACDLCARMGLDCFLAKRGALVTGCTCCISLYRECSFVHPKIPKGFVSTFPGISEDQQVCEGSITERRKSLKSFDEARGRKTGARFPRDAVKILKQWLADHTDHPYPNEREKDELKKITGLKRSQISNWLANARRRGKVRQASEPDSPVLGAIDIPESKDKDLSYLNPMERWKASPPENEPASMTAIAKAVGSTALPGRKSSRSSLHGSRANSVKASSEEDSGMSMFRAPSASSFETKESSNSDLTFASSRSRGSKGSLASSQERRRRRRAPMTQRAAAQQAKTRSARIFQCTFCTDTFPAKYDWQRHEKSLHLALERWLCCPEGGTMTVPLTGCTHCCFCQASDPTQEHLETHNFVACQEKTLQERTFYRKDHLRQHLKLMHGAKFEPHMEAWKRTNNEIKSGCGFCPSKFTTWQQRADHLAAHFRNGADMSTWANGWGFEPHIEKLVENSMPPYLIGHERSTMQPYVARSQNTPISTGEGSGLTFGTSAEGSEVDQLTKDSNCWGRLEQELMKYVTQQRKFGIVPTDKNLQDHARHVVYEDDDPWNWTCADNQQWLDTFKYTHGLGPITDAMHTPLLAEVPVMAPYVIRGGLRAKGTTTAAQQAPVPRSRHHSRHSSTSTTSSGVGSRGSRRRSSTMQKISQPASPAPVQNFDQKMDLDFDSIDFNTLNLDLGVDIDHFMDQNELKVNGSQLPTASNYNSTSPAQDMNQFYAPAQPVQPDSSLGGIDDHDIFGDDFDVNMLSTVPFRDGPQTLQQQQQLLFQQQREVQQQSNRNQIFFSDEELNLLKLR